MGVLTVLPAVHEGITRLAETVLPVLFQRVISPTDAEWVILLPAL